MADKFPELDIEASGQEIDGDFFSREKELVGDEFKTDQDLELASDPDNDEILEFKEQYPEVGGEAEAPADAPESEEDDYEGFSSAAPADSQGGESEPLKEWKQRRDLEIEKRESANAKKKEEIRAAAQQSIDDFYDNHNNKREQQSKQVLKEEEAFLAKRDDFLKRGTLWDRVNELIGDAGEGSTGDRDKSRFKGLLTKLKGKENVPGAGGFTS